MRTKMLNWKETRFLMMLLLTTNLFTFAVGTRTKLCPSRNGRSNTLCRESQQCCTDNFGRADCCSNNNLSGGAIAGIVVGIVVGTIILAVITILCVCIGNKMCSPNQISTSGYYATTTTRREVTTRRETTIPQPETRSVEIETPNQPPSNHSDSNTNNLDLPPPYPGNNHPPSYSEINI